MNQKNIQVHQPMNPTAWIEIQLPGLSSFEQVEYSWTPEQMLGTDIKPTTWLVGKNELICWLPCMQSSQVNINLFIFF